MLRNFLALTLGLLWLLGSIHAQDTTTFGAGDSVIVTTRLSVYTKPQLNATRILDILPGTRSRVLAVQQDTQGLSWYYLADDVFGWVPGTVNGQIILTTYSDDMWQTIERTAEATLLSDYSNLDALTTLGTIYHQQRNLDLALKMFQDAIAYYPEDYELVYHLVDVLYDRREFAEAASRLQDLDWVVNYRTPAVARMIALVDDAQMDAKYGFVSNATTYFEMAIGAYPDYAMIHYSLGRHHRRQRDNDLALASYTRALELDPYLVKAYALRGDIYAGYGQFDQALAEYNKALEIDPGSADIYVDRGIFYATHRHDPQRGIEDFNRALELDPNNDRAYGSRGASYMDMGQFEPAVDDFKRAVDLNPLEPLHQRNLAYAYTQVGLSNDALEAYDQAMDGGAGSYTYVLRGHVLAALGDYQAALSSVQSYEQMNRSDDDFGIATRLTLAYIHLHLGNYADSLAYYTEALKLRTDFVLAYSVLGTAYRGADARMELIGSLQQEITVTTNNDNLVLELGHLYMELGFWKEGLAQYEQYLSRNDNPELRIFVDGFAALLN